MNYSLLTDDNAILEACKNFSTLPWISVDFEGEFNLHIYGEHLCLIQIFDGEKFYIIDPRSQRVSPKGLEAFFSCPVEKLWFDCQSDLSLVRKVYDLDIANIYDIRVPARLLGYEGNLTGLILKYLNVDTNVGNKKENQQANWLKRPLSDELINYALSDVKYLHLIKPLLEAEIADNKLEKNLKFMMNKAVEKRTATPPYTKLCNWKRISPLQKVYVRNFYIARDIVARRFNLPAHHVLDKHKMVSAALLTPKTLEDAFSLFGNVNVRFLPYLEESFRKSYDKIKQESKNEVQKSR